MSTLLFDERPIVVNTVLAREIGLNEAIVLQQIHFWLEVNKQNGNNYIEGRYWTYNSIRAWHEKDFSFLSIETVKRTFSKLEKAGYLLTNNFNRDPRDKTKWYSINEDAIAELYEKVMIERDEGARIALTNALGQNDPMEKVNLTQCKESERTNGLGQCDPMQVVKETQPLPKNTTKIITENTSYPHSIIRSKPEDDRVMEELKEQVGYQLVEASLGKDKLSEWEMILRVLADVLRLREGTVMVSQSKLPVSQVQERIRELTIHHMEYMVECLGNVQEPIKNIRSYLLTVAYNAPVTIDAYYANQVKSEYNHLP